MSIQENVLKEVKEELQRLSQCVVVLQSDLDKANSILSDMEKGTYTSEKEPKFERVEYGHKYNTIRFSSDGSDDGFYIATLMDNGEYPGTARQNFEHNNYFHTKERAQDVVAQLEILMLLERMHDIYCPDYEPDWGKLNEKFYVHYSIQYTQWKFDVAYTIKDPARVYFPTREIAEKVCDILNYLDKEGK